MITLRARTVAHKTTEEMTEEEFQDFRRCWYRTTIRGLVRGGTGMEEAKIIAKKEFSSRKKHGFPSRNKTVLRTRLMRLSKVEKERSSDVESNDDLPGVDSGCQAPSE